MWTRHGSPKASAPRTRVVEIGVPKKSWSSATVGAGKPCRAMSAPTTRNASFWLSCRVH